jgi:cell division protein FtsQ
MNTGRAIRKILFVTIWVAIGGGMLTLLIAAIGKQKKDHCRDYTIRIKGASHNFSAGCCAFVDDKDVMKLLKAAAKGNVKGQPKSSFNLQQMELLLENNVWVKDAELYFDNHDVLHVTVTEREPIARLFTINGRSFYIDETEKIMPLSDKLSAKVPVFTGFPEKILSKSDSSLLRDVKSAALFILHDPFWMAQAAQIDITSEREFEMIPVVGNHTVLLGDGKNIDRKFHRLFVFYKNVLSQTGFDKYRAINVQYDGQVVGIKDKQGSKVDTSLLRFNIEKLLKESREVQSDSVIAARDIKEQKAIQVDPVIAATEKKTSGENPQGADNKSEQTRSLTNPVLVANPVSMKPLLDSKHNAKGQKNLKTGNEKKGPKAVMPKKSE